VDKQLGLELLKDARIGRLGQKVLELPFYCVEIALNVRVHGNPLELNDSRDAPDN
jgi:hypothetical protein